MTVFEYLQTDEAREVFKLGAASGLAFGGLGVAKDAYDNFTDRAQAQVDMVEEAVDKKDPDFLGKVDVLVKKDAISEKTAEAIKSLLEIKVKEKTGKTYQEFQEGALAERRGKIEEVRGKMLQLNEKIQKEPQKQAETASEGSP